MKYRAWILAVDSESYLGSEIFSSEAEAWTAICEQSDWALRESLSDEWPALSQRLTTLSVEDRELIRDALGEDSVFFAIEAKVIDVEGLEVLA